MQFVTSLWDYVQVDLHGMHVEEALNVLENHLLNLGGLGCPSGVLLQVNQCAFQTLLTSLLRFQTLRS